LALRAIPVANLVTRLETACAAFVKKSSVSVCLVSDGQRQYARWPNSDSAELRARDNAFHVGCLAKVFTAALVTQAAADGHLRLDSAIDRSLGEEPGMCTSFAAITLRQLMTHTHGLDGSALTVVPRTLTGRVDLAALCAGLRSAPPLFAPGRLCSYGNAGAWLSAAVLERHYNRCYSHLLRRELFAPLGMSPAEPAPTELPWCPAKGGTLRLSLEDLARFLLAQLSVEPQKHGAARFSNVMPGAPHPLPGWSAVKGYAIGWKYFGDGWYGHNSTLPGESLCVRFHRARRVAIIVAACGIPAMSVLAKLFRNGRTEFEPTLRPRPAEEVIAGQPADAVVGVYGNAALTVHVTKRAPGVLACRLMRNVSRREPPVLVQSGTLRPRPNSVFAIDAIDRPYCQFMQFVLPDARGAFTYAWSGRELWRRLDEVERAAGQGSKTVESREQHVDWDAIDGLLDARC